MMKNTKLIVIISVLVVLLIVAGAIFALGKDNNDSSQKNDTSNIQSTSDTVNIDIEMSDFKFSKNEIRAKAGETLRINLTSTGKNHNFFINELGVRSNLLNPGDSQTIEVKIPEDASGQSYKYYCSFGNHRVLGMEGTLVVE